MPGGQKPNGKQHWQRTALWAQTRRKTLVNYDTGKKKKKQEEEKQVVFWSEKYARRAKAERETALAKARDLAQNPGNYTRATSYGAAKYVKKIDYDKETGEILTS